MELLKTIHQRLQAGDAVQVTTYAFSMVFVGPSCVADFRESGGNVQFRKGRNWFPLSIGERAVVGIRFASVVEG